MLSGNLGGSDAYHVVTAASVSPETVLDGFTIANGVADGSGTDRTRRRAVRGGGRVSLNPELHVRG